MNIVFFPFAGGNKYSYQKFEVVTGVSHTLEYPGRGGRSRQTLLLDIDLVVEDALVQLRNLIDLKNKYVLFGHSMGALVAYLVCQKLVERGLPLPEKLIVSGKNAPECGRKKMVAELPDNDFWQELLLLGGIPETLKEHPGLIEYFIPILKADFRAIEKYKYRVTKKLPIPIDVFYGSDEGIEDDEVNKWKNETSEAVNIKKLKGTHFFIYDHLEFFLHYLNNLS